MGVAVFSIPQKRGGEGGEGEEGGNSYKKGVGKIRGIVIQRISIIIDVHP